ncbi:MAG: helix-turn-helix domain-containing protein [Myxococcota bacterium]
MSYSADARRLAVLAYKNSDWSLETTAQKLGVPRSALQRWLKRYDAQESLEDLPRSGRPPKLNQAQRLYFLELVQTHCDWTQQRLAQALNAKFEGLGASQVLICLELQRAGLTLKKNNSEPTNATPNESSD